MVCKTPIGQVRKAETGKGTKSIAKERERRVNKELDPSLKEVKETLDLIPK